MRSFGGVKDPCARVGASPPVSGCSPLLQRTAASSSELAPRRPGLSRLLKTKQTKETDNHWTHLLGGGEHQARHLLGGREHQARHLRIAESSLHCRLAATVGSCVQLRSGRWSCNHDCGFMPWDTM
ncbi:hypothetical protein AAFF_G00032620 [Aldrovandia affinis]|uniref:Uncharacterized protein n=1 Tax=Aldrovandia affinis TaxID=143900 RepID=A0AAD7S419_9TELE|nr:hypothetical protein AAFF_G00032620 [Aldrovandia affinis]